MESSSYYKWVDQFCNELPIYLNAIKYKLFLFYYFSRIYIPSGTWHFRVTISACKPIFRPSSDTSDLCIKGIALQGRSLPIFNHTHESSMGNLTTNSTYTFTEFSPFEDSYYYLLVASDTVIQFNVKVTVYGKFKIDEGNTCCLAILRLSINKTKIIKCHIQQNVLLK